MQWRSEKASPGRGGSSNNETMLMKPLLAAASDAALIEANIGRAGAYDIGGINIAPA